MLIHFGRYIVSNVGEKVVHLRGKKGTCTGVLISPYPDLLPDVFCLMVRILYLMLVLLYI